MSQMPRLSPGLWFTRHGHELGSDLRNGERKKPMGFKVGLMALAIPECILA